MQNISQEVLDWKKCKSDLYLLRETLTTSNMLIALMAEDENDVKYYDPAKGCFQMKEEMEAEIPAAAAAAALSLKISSVLQPVTPL